jgi:hypothetical protein
MEAYSNGSRKAIFTKSMVFFYLFLYEYLSGIKARQINKQKMLKNLLQETDGIHTHQDGGPVVFIKTRRTTVFKK